MLATCAPGLRGLRDRAILMTGFASGGRRRSELSGLDRDAIGLDDFAADGVVWIRLGATKTTRQGQTPRLVLKGRAARALVAWIDAAGDRATGRCSGRSPGPAGRSAGASARGDRRHRPAAAGPRRAAGGLRLGARPAVGVPDPGGARRRPGAGGDAAVAAPLGRPGDALLRRRRPPRKPRHRPARLARPPAAGRRPEPRAGSAPGRRRRRSRPQGPGPLSRAVRAPPARSGTGPGR